MNELEKQAWSQNVDLLVAELDLLRTEAKAYKKLIIAIIEQSGGQFKLFDKSLQAVREHWSFGSYSDLRNRHHFLEVIKNEN